MEQNQSVEQVLGQLFYNFIDAGLHGRFDDALDLAVECYSGVGMGEQGIFHGKAEAKKILTEGYISTEGVTIEYEVKNFTINMLSSDAAVMLGEVTVINTPAEGETMHSGLMQSIVAQCKDGKWEIAYTHSSPTVLTVESVEAYPIRFMDHTLSVLRAEMKTDIAAYRDSLTGILNREGMEHRAEEIMREYNPKNNTALLMVDLDDFKQINDRMGHQTGDLVLQQVAAILRDSFREVDAVGRIGGDEFMVLLTGAFPVKFLELKAEDLLKAMQLQLGDNQVVPISISIGIACGRARTTFEKIYRIADVALYTAKNSGKAQYHLINADTNVQYGYSGNKANLLSLQSLLNYTDGKTIDPSKTPYEALVENIPGGVVMFELTEDSIKVTHCNDWFCRLIGYSEDELSKLQKQNPFYMLHPDDLSIAQEVAQKIREGANSCNFVYRAICKDGSCIHINQVVSVMERRKGSILIYGIETDVEEAYELKQEVEESRKELEAFLDSIPGGVLSITLTDRIWLLHRNKWIPEFLGYEKQEMRDIENKNPFALVHPDDLPIIQSGVEKMKAGDKKATIIYRLLGKDGVYRHVCLNGSLIEYAEKAIIYYGVLTDVEEMTNVRMELERAKQLRTSSTAD